MAVDIARGMFSKTEYRYAEKSNPLIRAQQSSARSVELVTNLSKEGRDQLAQELLADLSQESKTFEIAVDGTDVVSLASFEGSPPMFLCQFEGFTASRTRTQKLVSVSIDDNANQTLLTVRG